MGKTGWYTGREDRERRKRMRAGRGRAEPQGSAGKEYCILCGRLTEAAKEQPLSEREYYIEGAGQLCRECYRELYVPRHNQNAVRLAR
ncbi:MAG TPA: hypothetical protein DDY31_07255 [Lachnospiraceae bacterium]|nr:hypothetical protein [Lachnospiraceae bacterium]